MNPLLWVTNSPIKWSDSFQKRFCWGVGKWSFAWSECWTSSSPAGRLPCHSSIRKPIKPGCSLRQEMWCLKLTCLHRKHIFQLKDRGALQLIKFSSSSERRACLTYREEPISTWIGELGPINIISFDRHKFDRHILFDRHVLSNMQTKYIHALTYLNRSIVIHHGVILKSRKICYCHQVETAFARAMITMCQL